MLLWSCVTGATLTKGPAALLPVLYIVIGSRVIAGRWRTMLRTGIAWGLPAALALAGTWALAAYAEAPQHFYDTFVRDEVVDRIVGRETQSRWVVLLELWKMPAYFLARFLPGSVLVVLALIELKPRRWMSHPLAPAILWLLLALGMFSLSAGKRPLCSRAKAA